MTFYSYKMKKYILRYNVDHKNGTSDRKWKIFAEDGSVFLLDSVKIMVPSWTEDTPFEGGTKYSVTMIGNLFIDSSGLHAVIRDY